MSCVWVGFDTLVYHWWCV